MFSTGFEAVFTIPANYGTGYVDETLQYGLLWGANYDTLDVSDMIIKYVGVCVDNAGAGSSIEHDFDSLMFTDGASDERTIGPSSGSCSTGWTMFKLESELIGFTIRQGEYNFL